MASLELTPLYWHCRASVDAHSQGSWDAVINDYQLEQLVKEIVTPWKRGVGFFLKGNRFHPDRSNIQIVHTPNNAISYTATIGYFRFVANVIADQELLNGLGSVAGQHGMIPFSVGQDYTSKLLLEDNMLEDDSPQKARESRIALRQLLLSNKFLDSDIEAICLDLYPAISSRFSSGMDRQQKLNILLAQSNPNEIYTYLERMYPARMPSQLLTQLKQAL